MQKAVCVKSYIKFQELNVTLRVKTVTVSFTFNIAREIVNKLVARVMLGSKQFFFNNAIYVTLYFQRMTV